MGAGNRNVVGGRYGTLTAAVLMVGATAVVMANVLLAPSPTDVRGQGAPVATPRPVTTASTSPATISAAITSAATSTAPVTGSARPRDRHRIPSAALVRLRTDVRGLTEPRPGRPTALRARLVAYHIDNWHSADDFTLLVSVDLHFSPGAWIAWNEGSNGRFVRLRRTAGTYRSSWASGP